MKCDLCGKTSIDTRFVRQIELCPPRAKSSLSVSVPAALRSATTRLAVRKAETLLHGCSNHSDSFS